MVNNRVFFLAVSMHLLEPKNTIICMIHAMSSLPLKKGYFPQSRERKITPTDQMSRAKD